MRKSSMKLSFDDTLVDNFLKRVNIVLPSTQAKEEKKRTLYNTRSQDYFIMLVVIDNMGIQTRFN